MSLEPNTLAKILPACWTILDFGRGRRVLSFTVMQAIWRLATLKDRASKPGSGIVRLMPAQVVHVKVVASAMASPANLPHLD